MISVFGELRKIYPKQWNKMFRNQGEMDTSMMEWDAALISLTDHEIKLGVDRCRVNLKDFPTVEQFLYQAKGGKTSEPEGEPIMTEIGEKRAMDYFAEFGSKRGRIHDQA